MSSPKTLHKQWARQQAAFVVTGAAALLAGLAFPSGPVIVIASAVPFFCYAVWQLKCPHCGQRIAAADAAIEWEKVGALRWQPSRCGKCGGTPRRER